MKKQRRKGKRKLFHPDKIATEIHQALFRDFREAQHEYCLNDDTVLYALNRQVNELQKKYLATDYDKKAAEERTYQKFLAVNSHIGKVNAELSEYFGQLTPTRINQHTLPVDSIFIRARALAHFVLGPSCHLEDVFSRAKHSSGSSVGVPFRDTSLERKWRLPVTVTERVKPLMSDYLDWDESLMSAVTQRETQSLGYLSVVEGSRATTVDKNTEIRRFCCPEPTGNMFLQQGLMQLMFERFESVGLNLPDLPEEHKERARLASLSGDEATIDWSSASDCVSTEILRWLLPAPWYRMVMDLRCDTTCINNSQVVELNMVSTMGNATTFPLETLVFWTIGHAVRLYLSGSRSLFPEWDELKTVSVFGDDCIVPSHCASLFVEACESVGFIINEEKSFVDPTFRFRESCGGDYLAGYDVRPFYLKAPTSTSLSALEPWLYIIGNSLLKKYILYFGQLSYVYHSFWSTYFELFRRYGLKLKLVPSYFPDDAGFKGGFDLPRFNRLYDINFDVITRSEQGTYQFRYCRFVYWQNTGWNDDIRLATWLKDQGFMPPWRKPLHQSPLRKRGGYVVGKAISAHWTLPA